MTETITTPQLTAETIEEIRAAAQRDGKAFTQALVEGRVCSIGSPRTGWIIGISIWHF